MSEEEYEIWAVPGYDDMDMKIPVKYADVIRINTSYIKDRLISEFVNDLKNENIEIWLLIKKWEDKLK